MNGFGWHWRPSVESERNERPCLPIYFFAAAGAGPIAGEELADAGCDR
jgi:hypothetical protein